LYNSTARTIVSGPNAAATTFNLAHLPSDGVVAKAYGAAASTVGDGGTLASAKSYIVRDVVSTTEVDLTNGVEAGTDKIGDAIAANTAIVNDAADDPYTARARTESFGNGDKIVTTGSGGSAAIAGITADTGSGKTTTATFAEVRTDDNKFVKGESYVIYSLGTNGSAVSGDSDGTHIKAAASASMSGVTALTVGMKFTIDSDASDAKMDRVNALVKGMTFTKASDTLTKDIEAVQAKVNTARVQAGSQYAAMESAVDYTTDLTAQYELGFNTVNDVNFSMETAHLAKNQILQQAATAMLAQANQGQQGLLQLIQG
jgi:flagellin